MRKSITIFVCILVGCFLPSCDFYAGKYISLTPVETYKPPESNIALQNDFNEVARIVESFAAEQGFIKSVEESKSLHQVYQKGDKLPTIYRIYITFSESKDLIVVSVLKMQSRKPSETQQKIYIALRDKLQEKFGSRIKGHEPKIQKQPTR